MPNQNSTLSNNDHAKMVDWLYHSDKNFADYVPEGWELHKKDVNPATGYEGACFINPETKEFVVVHKGSDFNFDWHTRTFPDWKGNLDAVKNNQAHDQINDAIRLTEELNAEFPGWSMGHVGHSLGGYLSTIMLNEYPDATGVAFDPLYGDYLTGDPNLYDRLNLILPDGKGVYEWTKEIHNKSEVADETLHGIINNHKMKNFLKDDELNMKYEDRINPIAENTISKSSQMRSLF